MVTPVARWSSTTSWISSTPNREGRHDRGGAATGRAERTWWREHRDAKQIFSEELRAARGILAHGPKHEIYGYFDGQPVRRLLLERTRCHVYYVVLEREDVVRIVAVWGAMKGTAPRSIKPLPER